MRCVTNVVIVACFALTPLWVNAAEIVVLEQAGIDVVDVSADGQVVVGNILWMEGRQAMKSSWRWTKLGGIEELGLPDGDYASSEPFSVSADGTVIAGTVFRSTTVIPNPGTAEPWYWSVEDGWEPLELPEGAVGGAWSGISADGSTIAGGDGGPALWTNGQLVQSFSEAFEGYVSHGAGKLSADGNTVVGSVKWNEDDLLELYVWTSQGGLEMVGGNGKGDVDPSAISSDGSVVVGHTRFNSHTWKWTQSGSFVGLSNRGLSSVATDVNRDGSVVIGFSSGRDSRTTALVWDADNEPHDLRSLLEDEHGLQDIPSQLSRATGISDDGRVIVGYDTDFDGRPIGEGWIVQLDRPIFVTTGVLGDFNGNAELDVQDLELLDGELQSNRNVALFDVNVDETVNLNDRRHWVHSLANTYFGDSNLDGEFNSTDLVAVFEAGQYEDNVDGNSSWGTGDWNGDGEFTSGDLVSAFQDGGYEQGPRPLAAVPEPHCHFMLMIGCVLLFVQRRNLHLELESAERRSPPAISPVRWRGSV